LVVGDIEPELVTEVETGETLGEASPVGSAAGAGTARTCGSWMASLTGTVSATGTARAVGFEAARVRTGDAGLTIG
jgi:hypothetical protein